MWPTVKSFPFPQPCWKLMLCTRIWSLWKEKDCSSYKLIPFIKLGLLDLFYMSLTYQSFLNVACDFKMVQAGGISDMYWHFSGTFSMCFYKYKSFTARLSIKWGNQWACSQGYTKEHCISAWWKMELQLEHPCHLISLCYVQRGFMGLKMGFC